MRTTETARISWKKAQTLLKVLMADKEYNTALLFASGFYFGLRIGDILRLKWGQITSSSFRLIEGKTKKKRAIDIHKDFTRLVNKVIKEIGTQDPEQFVFVAQRRNMRKDRPISLVAANKRIKKAFDQYGIETQNPSSHTLRKTFARRVYENEQKSEAALILLSKILNHRDTATTRKYIGITNEQIVNAYLSL